MINTQLFKVNVVLPKCNHGLSVTLTLNFTVNIYLPNVTRMLLESWCGHMAQLPLPDLLAASRKSYFPRVLTTEVLPAPLLF